MKIVIDQLTYDGAVDLAVMEANKIKTNPHAGATLFRASGEGITTFGKTRLDACEFFITVFKELNL